MDAAALTCPQCGAAASVDATVCTFCQARLATVACPSCFGLVFVGSKHCAHCGAEIRAVDRSEEGPRHCPRGCGQLRLVTLGDVELEECERCSGVWLEQRVFQRLCADEEHRTVSLGAEFDARRESAVAVQTVRYVPCPTCAKLMNRVNFGKQSGIILDCCAAHGTWFDADELRRVVEFVRDGGLDRARTHERLRLAEERRLLEVRKGIAGWNAPAPNHRDASDTERPSSIGELFALLMRDG
jgi:Zn-finger nucleic acid-binding protein